MLMRHLQENNLNKTWSALCKFVSDQEQVQRTTQILCNCERSFVFSFYNSSSCSLLTFQIILAHVAGWGREIKQGRNAEKYIKYSKSAIRKWRQQWNETPVQHMRAETATKPREHCAFVADIIEEILRGFCLWMYCLLACQNIEYLEASGANYCSFSMSVSLLLENSNYCDETQL